MSSTFYYDFSSVWQTANPLIWENYHNFPASTGNYQAYNSPWSQTVVFGETRFDYVWNIPWPNATSTGHHMWIQEDAWGNCTYNAS